MPLTSIADITSKPIGSVAQLIDHWETFQSLLAGVPTQRLAFRGQPQEYGTLVPSVARQFSRNSAGAADVIERRLIDEFRRHYSGLGDRSHDMPSPARIGKQHDLRCLSVMQHYEIPTRLLDWSSDFWTAVYFACASDPDKNAELWYYDRLIFDRQRIGNPDLASLLDGSENPPVEPAFIGVRAEALLVELDPQITPRMKRQLAHHTVSTNVFSDHALQLLSMANEMPPDPPNKHLFRRLIIHASCKGKALQFLAEEKDITASTIFPDVVGLGRFLRWQLESLKTMLL